MGVDVRPARKDDAADLVVCIDAAYQAARDRGVALPPVSDGIGDDIRDNLVWVALTDKQIAGGIVVSTGGDSAHLVNIAVDPRFSGQGIGRALIEAALVTLRGRRITRIDLATHVEMPENVALYIHLGWTETGRQADKVHMSRMLDGSAGKETQENDT